MSVAAGRSGWCCWGLRERRVPGRCPPPVPGTQPEGRCPGLGVLMGVGGAATSRPVRSDFVPGPWAAVLAVLPVALLPAVCFAVVSFAVFVWVVFGCFFFAPLLLLC